MRVKAVLAAVALSLSIPAAAEVLDMVYLTTDAQGQSHYVERKFYNYGNKANNWKYKGTRWWIVNQYGRTVHEREVYFDCSDSTWGLTAPTREDIMTGSIIHLGYRRACHNE